jgi:hypothetical protein
VSQALPQIPLIDARRGGTAEIARVADDRMRDLLQDARRLYTPPLLALADLASRDWLERCHNPYTSEIDEIAALIGSKGAHALNTSYEWACTSAVCDDPEGGVRLLRALDWKLMGLGKNLVAAWQSGPAGDFLNVTWPGFVGVITAMAPGRFAAAINQPPMTSFGLTLPFDWIVGRIRMLHSDGIPPAHLLRRVFEHCGSYPAAKRMLVETPICAPAFFALAGAKAGEGCIIERTLDRAGVREMPTAIANDWVALPERGHSRSSSSRDRQRTMERALSGQSDWRAPPVLNPDTRMLAVMNPAAGSVTAQGYDGSEPATAPFVMPARRRTETRARMNGATF